VSAAAHHPLAAARVLICGASGGIGSALVREIDRRGAIVTVAARDRERLLGLPAAEIVAGDLRDPTACEAAVACAAGEEGLDVLVNAVGTVAFGEVSEVDPEVVREVLEINALVPILLARAALPRMRPGGAIVNLSGVIAERPLPGMTAYSAAKGAVRAFDQALEREARRSKIRVIDARPPHTETGLAQRPLAGTAPALRPGLAPDTVAQVICEALEQGLKDLPSATFAAWAA
jgi:cyclic-di-GMP-binding biofilm dispersal mediator protein